MGDIKHLETAISWPGIDPSRLRRSRAFTRELSTLLTHLTILICPSVWMAHLYTLNDLYYLCLHIRTRRMCQHKTGILWFRYRFVELGQGFLNKNKQENVNCFC